jgi:hypothetical protein
MVTSSSAFAASLAGVSCANDGSAANIAKLIAEPAINKRVFVIKSPPISFILEHANNNRLQQQF